LYKVINFKTYKTLTYKYVIHICYKIQACKEWCTT